MKTRITELFNIEHPIIQGGMHFVGFSELVAAVSNAGGLGIITALTQPTPKDLANEIAKCHDMTDKPFGVNLTFIPSFKDPPYDEYIDAIIQGGIKIVETAGRNPEKYMPQLKDAGIKVIHKCTSVRHGILLPRAAEELKIPFVASGGMANARSLVSALAFGAEGMNMGTRFIATKEAPVHDNVKQRLVEASELETRLVMRPLRNTERVLVNKAVDQIMEIEASHKDNNDPNALLEEIRPLVAGSERVLRDGDLEAAAWSCGMVAGLIHDVPTCQELIDTIMKEADEIINERLKGYANA